MRNEFCAILKEGAIGRAQIPQNQPPAHGTQTAVPSADERCIRGKPDITGRIPPDQGFSRDRKPGTGKHAVFTGQSVCQVLAVSFVLLHVSLLLPFSTGLLLFCL